MSEQTTRNSPDLSERDVVLAIAALGLLGVMGATWFFLS